MKATGSLILLILPILIIQTRASVFDWDDERLFKHEGIHDWVNDEQQAELLPLRSKPTEFRDKTLEFYNKLPKEQKTVWDNFYRKYCVVWLKQVASDDEIKELREMESKESKLALLSKINSYKSRLKDDYRSMVDVWEETCDKLLTAEDSRKRREIDKNFNDFIQWMTDEQKQSINDMKATGSSFDEIREKGNEFFGNLATDRQVSLKEEFKQRCKTYFEKISNPEEVEKMKSLYESGEDAEIRSIIKNVVARQTGDDKKLAVKMEKLCTDVFDVKVRRNSIDGKINRRLSWMTDEQKQEVKKMYADGKPQAEIRAKIFEFLSAIEGPAGLAAKEQTRKECYKWMEEVASTEEIAALHQMHETDHDGCKKKVREFIGRLPADKREEVEKNLPFCEKVWYGEHAHHSGHGHHNHHLAVRRRRHLHAIDRFLNWLTPEQKSKLEEVENSGAHFDNVIELVKKYYAMLPEEKKAELKANFKSQCFTWVKEVATSDELESIIKMHESKDHVQLKKKLAELESRLTEEQKHTIEHVRDVCLGVWEVQDTRKRRSKESVHEHNLQEAIETYLTWMTPEDKEKVRVIYDSSNREAFYNEILDIMESSSDEVRMKGVKELKAACKHYGKDVLGEENISTIEELKESGATYEEISKKVDEMIEEISDPQRKIKATRLSAACKKIYYAGRSRRDHHSRHHHHSLEVSLQKYLTWLDDSQKNELKTLEESGHKKDIYKKIMQYYEAANGEVEEKATEELQSACKHYTKDFVGEEKAAKFKEMKEEGKPVEEIAKKVEEAIGEIPDEAVMSRAKEAIVLCEKVFGVPKRLRRDHEHKHSLEEAMGKYLTWLSDDQKIVIKSIYDVGDRGAVYEKVIEFFENADEETKDKATKELKDACKHYIKDLIGEGNGKLLREMKENGASNDAIATKVEEMIEEISDEAKKAEAIKASFSCKKVYGVARRLKRAHEHTLSEAMEKYLTWLSKEQKDEVQKIYDGGDREAVYKKVLEYFEEATGETKEKAAEELKSACKHYVRDAIGEENAAKIKAMKDSGVSNEEIAKKVDEFIEMINDNEKKAKALRASTACKKVYGVAKHHEHNLDEALEKFLTWLSKEQKDEVQKIYDGGDREAVYKKVLEYFEEAAGETKEKAAEELKSACRHYIKDSVGDENAAKIKAMKDSGVSNEEIAKKVDEFIEMISDSKKKETALRASKACKKIYGVVKRMRRDHHEHNFEEAMQKYLNWLSDDQKTQVKKVYGTGDRLATYNKVLELFDSATGDEKEKATTQLKAACKHFIKDFIGSENVAVIKTMKENGATNEEISSKIDEFIAALTDEKKKAQAERAATACKKIYSVKNRKRRNQQEINFEEALTKYLTWLNEEQKAELEQLKEKNEKEAIYNKIMEYFESTSGDIKQKAREELKSACKHYIQVYVGDKKAEELKALRDSGISMEEMMKKVNEAIEMITDEAAKAKAQKLSAPCQKVFGVAKVRRHLAAKHRRYHLDDFLIGN